MCNNKEITLKYIKKRMEKEIQIKQKNRYKQ